LIVSIIFFDCSTCARVLGIPCRIYSPAVFSFFPSCAYGLYYVIYYLRKRGNNCIFCPQWLRGFLRRFCAVVVACGLVVYRCDIAAALLRAVVLRCVDRFAAFVSFRPFSVRLRGVFRPSCGAVVSRSFAAVVPFGFVFGRFLGRCAVRRVLLRLSFFRAVLGRFCARVFLAGRRWRSLYVKHPPLFYRVRTGALLLPNSPQKKYYKPIGTKKGNGWRDKPVRIVFGGGVVVRVWLF
jgi:hypothetical protein